MEALFKDFILSSLENSGNGHPEGSVELCQIILGIVHGRLSLSNGSSSSDPSEHFSSGVENENIVGIEKGSLNSSSLGNFLEFHFAGSIAELEEFLVGFVLMFRIISSSFSRSNGSLRSKSFPEIGNILA